MHCPHCNEKIPLFSRTVNSFGKIKVCPRCRGLMRLAVNWPRLALLFLPAVWLGLVLGTAREALGASGAIATGVAVGLLVAYTLKLNPEDLSPEDGPR